MTASCLASCISAVSSMIGWLDNWMIGHAPWRGREPQKVVVVLWDTESLCSTRMLAACQPKGRSQSPTACSFLLRNVQQQALPQLQSPSSPRGISSLMLASRAYIRQTYCGTARVMRCHIQQPAWTTHLIRTNHQDQHHSTGVQNNIRCSWFIPVTQRPAFPSKYIFTRGRHNDSHCTAAFLFGQSGWHDWDSGLKKVWWGLRGSNSNFKGPPAAPSAVVTCLGMSSKIHLLLCCLEAQPRSHD
ncbi:hypothetical protein GE09DRAFT_614253 [Coniochaeta sp. 2T2.1]|nr:hypothetical protein GE09DRAFT_614253 [Coniochaeta sp. 2T2.1]